MFNQLEILSDEQSEKLYTIRRYIKNLDSVCIAYSGGVDSTLVASLAFEQLGSKAIAITGISPALATTLREEARRQDDLKDYRPGIQASKQAGVISPLAKFKVSKQDIRDISRALGFPWWDKPAQPCLSSRFPYGHEITSERLKMVEKAEEYLKECGLSEVRVRCQGSTARIEIPQDELKHFFNKYNFSELVQYFSNLGFNCTSLDLEGLVSGKLNR